MFPLAFERREQLVVGRFDRHVHRSGHEVEGADGVPPPRIGFADGYVVLEVGAAGRYTITTQSASPPAFQEDPGLFQVARLPQCPAEFGEPHLDLGMAADLLPAVVAESVADMVCGTAGHLDQWIVEPDRTRPGNRRLEQVAGAVQFVAVLEVGVAALLVTVPVAGVDVAVRILGSGHSCGQAVQSRVGLLVPGTAVLPGQGFHQLVDLGVGEAPPGPVGGGRALGDPVEVGQPTQPLHPFLAVTERCKGVDALSAFPKSRGQGDLTQPERAVSAL